MKYTTITFGECPEVKKDITFNDLDVGDYFYFTSAPTCLMRKVRYGGVSDGDVYGLSVISGTFGSYTRSCIVVPVKEIHYKVVK